MSALRFRLFGSLRADRDGRDVTPRWTEDLTVLAALLLHAGRAVPTATLVDAVWDGHAPQRPDRLLDEAVGNLNFEFASAGPGTFGIDTTAAGRTLSLGAPCRDLDDFRALAREGLARSTHGDHRGAAPLLGQAMAVGHRPVLLGLTGRWFARARESVERDEVLPVAVALADALLATAAPNTAARIDDLVTWFRGSPALWERLAHAYLGEGRPEQARDALQAARTYLGAVFDDPATRLPALEAHVRALAPGVWTVLTGPAPKDRGVPAAPRPAPGPSGAAPKPPPTVSYRVLGRLRVDVGDYEVTPLLDREDRAVLVALLLRHPEPVPDDVLTAALSGDEPFDGNVGRKVSTMIDALTQGLRWPSPVRIGASGWTIDVPPDGLDLTRAARLAAAGFTAAAAGKAADAAVDLRAAVALVPAEPLPGLRGPWFAKEREHILGWRRTLVESCVRAEVDGGAPARAVPDLEAMLEHEPLREDVWGLLLTALARCGRSDDAVRAYQRGEHRMHRLLGTGPGPTLRLLRDRIAAGETV